MVVNLSTEVGTLIESRSDGLEVLQFSVGGVLLKVIVEVLFVVGWRVVAHSGLVVVLVVVVALHWQHHHVWQELVQQTSENRQDFKR